MGVHTLKRASGVTYGINFMVNGRQVPEVVRLLPSRLPAGATVLVATALGALLAVVWEAGEWFGHSADSEFTKESARVLAERATGEQA